VRVLLAEAYRRDRQWPEAGRWDTSSVTQRLIMSVAPSRSTPDSAGDRALPSHAYDTCYALTSWPLLLMTMDAGYSGSFRGAGTRTAQTVL
jgi:hypothetical protein